MTTVVITKDTGTTADGMELDALSLRIMTSLKVAMIWIKGTAMVCTSGMMGVYTLDSSSRINDKEEVPIHGPMAPCIRVNSKLDIVMVKACTDLQMGQFTLESGKTENTTE